LDSLQIQFAEPTDAAETANLLSSGFRPEVAQLLIHGCHGASAHIRMQLGPGAPPHESAYFVARAPDCIAGAVELRRHPNGLFLNYIGVLAAYRGQRVATTLLAEAVRMSGVPSGQIALDVLDDNAVALEWYQRLGFVSKTGAEFVELAPPDTEDEEPAYASGLPQADLCQQSFGFSKFDLISKKGRFSVGRIGDGWFRLTDMAAAGDPAIFAALHQMDPGRRTFAVLPAFPTAPVRVVRLLAKTRRMEAEIGQLLSTLSNQMRTQER
jgi:GNAT superfamily N-acetyltransferase